jgi:hypothetical protein
MLTFSRRLLAHFESRISYPVSSLMHRCSSILIRLSHHWKLTCCRGEVHRVHLDTPIGLMVQQIQFPYYFATVGISELCGLTSKRRTQRQAGNEGRDSGSGGKSVVSIHASKSLVAVWNLPKVFSFINLLRWGRISAVYLFMFDFCLYL